MIELAILISLVFGGIVGLNLGSTNSKNAPIAPVVQPRPASFQDNDADSHRKLMMQCSVTCDERGVLSYNILTGVCKCARNKGSGL